ncbi:protein phosphatase 2C 29-like, partial [Trifolium pratense]
MGNGVSSLCSCFEPVNNNRTKKNQQVIFTQEEPLDETLGHSFCYVRSSARFISPTHSDRFLSPSTSLRFSPTHESVPKTRPDFPETTFKAISGASVSANSSVPKTVIQLEEESSSAPPVFDSAVKGSIVNGFESTSSFSALPLQPVPRGGELFEGSGYFLSGPNESGAHSGPINAGSGVDSGFSGGRDVPFSAPLGGVYGRKKGVSGFRKAFQRKVSDKKRPWVVPVLNFVGRKEVPVTEGREKLVEVKSESNVQWALGKAGEDRVHVVVSEEQGWLFVGIYDGFNGPDAPEFLMGNMYRAVYNELQGLFWEVEETMESNPVEVKDKTEGENSGAGLVNVVRETETGTVSKRRRLWEFLAEDPEDGLDLSGSDRFAFSVDDALSVSNSNAGSASSRRWLLLSKLKNGLSKHREGNGRKLLPWNLGNEEEKEEKSEVENKPSASGTGSGGGKRRKLGPVDHDLVLNAMSRALQVTELAYLDMTDKRLDTNPELALMGSCLLVVLMRDDDVYVMNVGDSRAIVAHYEPKEGQDTSNMEPASKEQHVGVGSSSGSIVEELLALDGTQTEGAVKVGNQGPAQEMRLAALQLSTDHSTSIEESGLTCRVCLCVHVNEIIRIKNEHPDDPHCIVNDRVKGRLKVTRAFGAGFLKQIENNVVISIVHALWDNSSEFMLIFCLMGIKVYCSSCLVPPQHFVLNKNVHLIVAALPLLRRSDTEKVVTSVKLPASQYSAAAGSPKLNAAVLEMFRNEYIGTAPYVSCFPSVRHHRLCPRDQFLILSSDGLYQYLNNEEVVSQVESFMEKFPEGDPAQHLIEELLVRAAKKA